MSAGNADVMRRYLLGTLPEDQAAAVEERYFTDPTFFNELRSLEIQMVRQFLDKKLPPEEQEQFERRLALTPALRDLVERFRKRM